MHHMQRCVLAMHAYEHALLVIATTSDVAAVQCKALYRLLQLHVWTVYVAIATYTVQTCSCCCTCIAVSYDTAMLVQQCLVSLIASLS